MNHFTKITVLAAGLAAAIPYVSAAESTSVPAPGANAPAATGHVHARGRAWHRQAAFRHMARRLHLSQDQIGQMRAIRSSTHRAVASIRANASLTREQQRSQIRALHATSRQQMLALLNSEQKARLERMHRRVEERLGGL